MEVKEFINERVCGSTPLMYACFSSASNPEILEYLLDNGADIEAKNLSGINALMWAVERMNHRAVEVLLRRGAIATSSSADGDAKSMNRNGQKSVSDKEVALFLSSSSSGLTPLHKACRQGNVGMVRVLVEVGKGKQRIHPCIYSSSHLPNVFHHYPIYLLNNYPNPLSLLSRSGREHSQFQRTR